MKEPTDHPTTTIAIADDHQLFIAGIRMLIKAEEDMRCVGEAHNGIDIQTVVRDTQPSIVLLDMNMPGKNGQEATEALRAEFPALKILILTMNSSMETITEVMDAGANGYILKTSSKAELVDAIRALNDGGTYYSSKVTDTLIQGMTTATKERNKANEEPEVQLTRREKEVLALILKEHTTHEIATQLFIAESTVITHRKNLLHKAGSRNTAGLVQCAIRNGWVDAG